MSKDIDALIQEYGVIIDPSLSLDECIWSLEQQVAHNNQKRERVYNLFMKSPFGHLVTSESGRITDINDAMLKMLGYERREEVKYRPVVDFIHPDDIHPQREFIDKVVKEIEKDNQFRNVRYKHKDGHYITCRTSVVATQDHHDDTYILAYIRMPETAQDVQ